MPKFNIIKFFKTIFGSNLKSVSNHTTSQQENRVIVVILGRQYQVACSENDLIFTVLTQYVPEFFRNGVPCVVKLRTHSGNEISCLICFHDIPEIPQLDRFSQPSFLPMAFSVCVFEKRQFIDVHFATKSDGNSPNFALGCFNAKSFIVQFRTMSWHEHRIPILWKMFVDALCRIGYFDIYDYNQFQSLVLRYFRRMFSFPEYRQDFKRKMFFLFVQRLLAKNSWFLIVGEFIQYVQCPPCSLIELFSDRQNPPIANFIDHELGFIGVSRHSGNGYSFKTIYELVSLKTLQVCMVGNSDMSNFQFSPISEHMLSILFPFFGDDNDDDCSPPPLFRRRPAIVDTSEIEQGFKTFGNNCLIVFKRRNEITVFIKREDGTIEPFNIYLFILSKMLADGNELAQLIEHFTHFPFIPTINLIDGLLQCGFQPIFDGTATVEQINAFLVDSDFGCVLKMLCEEFTTHNECLDSIRESRFISDFNGIFKFILQQLGKRPDLTPEIIEILRFLGQMVEFLNQTHSDMSD